MSEPKCSPHYYGVPIDYPLKRFFQPGCPRCESKLAAGLVSADDPPPLTNWKRRPRLQQRPKIIIPYKRTS